MFLFHCFLGSTLFSVLFLSLAVNGQINLCDNNCEGTADIVLDPSQPDVDTVSVRACENALVKVALTAGDNPNGKDCSLSLSEKIKIGDLEDYYSTFYFSSNNNLNKEIISQSSEVFVTFALDCKFSLKASCVMFTSREESFTYNENATRIESAPNSLQTFSFNGDDTQIFAFTTPMADPLQGYMVVSTEDGYGHMVYGDLQPLVVQTKTSFANIQIVTLSAPREERNGSLSWNVGEEPVPTTTTTIAPTTTTEYREIVKIMVLGVNENKFVKENMGSLQAYLDNILKGFCNLPPGDSVTLSNTVSCRRSCWMTDDIDRGCVQIDADLTNVSPTTICTTSDGLSKTGQFRELVKDSLKDLTKELNAVKMYVDECNDIEISKPWVIILIVVGSAFILLAFGIFAMFTLPGYLRALRTFNNLEPMEGEVNFAGPPKQKGVDDRFEYMSD